MQKADLYEYYSDIRDAIARETQFEEMVAPEEDRADQSVESQLVGFER
jgi:hypothetical protein